MGWKESGKELGSSGVKYAVTAAVIGVVIVVIGTVINMALQASHDTAYVAGTA